MKTTAIAARMHGEGEVVAVGPVGGEAALEIGVDGRQAGNRAETAHGLLGQAHEPQDGGHEAEKEIRSGNGTVLDLGIDGFRLDAVPYLFERDDTNCENLPETHAYLKTVRKYIEDNYDDKVLLAEPRLKKKESIAGLWDTALTLDASIRKERMFEAEFALWQQNGYPDLKWARASDLSR